MPTLSKLGGFRPPGPVVFNRSSPFAAGLVAWWPMGPTARELAFSPGITAAQSHACPDIVGNAWGATNPNSQTTVLRTERSPHGLVALCESVAAQSWYEVPAPGTLWDFSAQEATISFWCKRGASENNSVGFPFRFNSNEGDSGSYYPWIDGFVYCGVFNTARSINGVLATSAGVTLTDWHMVTLTTKAGTNNYRLFQNDKLLAQATRAGFSSTFGDSKILLMANNSPASGGTRKWGGAAFDFRLWNRALSDQEVFALYNPQMRWDLYVQPRQRSYAFVTGGGGGGGSTFPALTVAV